MCTKKQFNFIVSIVLLVLWASPALFSHCQVPCGIYDDAMRVKMMKEHITTIGTAMKSIIDLSNDSKPNYNQIVRWVTNKEKHAEELSDIITYYFMAQRIPLPKDEASKKSYLVKLSLLHKLLVLTMKAKQSTDLTLIQPMKTTLGEFEEIYFIQSKNTKKTK